MSVDDVLVGFLRNASKPYPRVVFNDAFIHRACVCFAEAYFLHAKFAAFRAFHLHFQAGWPHFIVQMQFRQRFPPCRTPPLRP